MDLVVSGLIFATVALVVYNIYEAVKMKGLKYGPFLNLARSLKFSDEVSSLLWKKAKYKFTPLVSYKQRGQATQAVGLEIENIRDSLEEKICSDLPKDYVCFASFLAKNYKNLGIIKSKDKYGILKAMNTNGESYGLPNTKLIGELRKIEKVFPFTITGAGYDWVEIAFNTLPEDVGQVTDMILELSPPLEDESEAADYREKVEEDLRSAQKITIWWPIVPR